MTITSVPRARWYVFPPEQHLSAAAAKAEYDKHQNSPHDTGCRRFLGRLFTPLALY
ncbi:MAG: hypothetical protein ACTIJ4_02465 [Halomonas sp.]|uniref:hypothetical protein n=1 Tax=unclassified Halomonas TaxID=2609666 RepID=UPI003F97CAAD